MQLLLLLVVALTITVALIPPLANFAGRLRLLDRPGERKVHAAPIPRIGGLAMVVGTLFPLWFMAPQPGEWIAIHCAAGVLLVMGLLDDRHELAWHWKLAAQVLACALAVTLGGVSIDSTTLTERIELPAGLSLALSFVFLVGVTNAINLSDGLDGLAGGTTLLSVLAIGWIGISTGNGPVSSMTAALAGALLGFLRFNTHPARVFMGDSGSQVLGFLAGVLAIKATQGADISVSAALPLLLLAWPILDTLTVMSERIRNGLSPFAADRRHFHHRLLSLGFDHYQSVLIIYAVQCGLFLLAYLLRFESDVVIVGVFAVFATLTIGLLDGARRHEWRWSRPARATSELARRVRWLSEHDRLRRCCRALLLTLLAGYSACVAFGQGAVSTDVAWLAAVLILAQLVVLISGNRPISMQLLRLVLFVAAAMLVYLDQQSFGVLAPQSIWQIALFAGMSILVLIRFRTSGERRFAFTTLDALVLFVAVIAPVVAAPVDSATSVGLGIFKLVAIGYAIEFSFDDWNVARVGALVTSVLLASIALRVVLPM
jgi:UDP-GlcNAc:undecaprenyl-phosphate/decaprenyl-phosphate GlcNAc-1-phosphate transferase